MSVRVCVGCGGRFTPTRVDHWYCSARCRKRKSRDIQGKSCDSKHTMVAVSSVMSVSVCASLAALVALLASGDERAIQVVEPEQVALCKMGMELAASFVATHGGYLDLPPAIRVIADDPLYALGRPCGFDGYMEMAFEQGSDNELVYVPLDCTRKDILVFVRSCLYIVDPRYAMVLSLAWRVGYVVGWLSGLRLHQPDDVQRGLMMLALLVTPLVMSSRSDVRLLARHEVT